MKTLFEEVFDFTAGTVIEFERINKDECGWRGERSGPRVKFSESPRMMNKRHRIKSSSDVKNAF